MASRCRGLGLGENAHAVTFGSVRAYKPSHVSVSAPSEGSLSTSASPFDLVLRHGSGTYAEEIAAVHNGVIRMNVDTDAVRVLRPVFRPHDAQPAASSRSTARS